jgi:hypothetical protein
VKIDIHFLLQCCFDVYVGQHAKSFLLQLIGHLGNGVVERDIHRGTEVVFHGFSPFSHIPGVESLALLPARRRTFSFTLTIAS